MWSLLFFGNPLMAVLRGPLALLSLVGALVAICGCIRCLGVCRLRNCAVFKHFLICIGHDLFEDFELMVLVHEVFFDSIKKDRTTVVQVTAGRHTVKTPANSNGIFQQPLHITVEQGTEELVIDLLNVNNNLLATVKLDAATIHDATNLEPEVVYNMTQKGKGVHNPRIKLTMVASSEDDAEKGLVNDGTASDVAILVKQQLKKARQKHDGTDDGPVSELDVLKEACAGPLELFEGLGQTQKVYVAVVGPPISRRWIMGIWRDQREFAEKKPPVQEVGLLKIQSIQADPQRNHVFVVNCYDESRVRQSLTFRRVDRARDVWVEILHILVTKAREAHQKVKDQKKSPSSSSYGADTKRRPPSSPRPTENVRPPARGRGVTFAG